jgi:hypothetical protein
MAWRRRETPSARHVRSEHERPALPSAVRVHADHPSRSLARPTPRPQGPAPAKRPAFDARAAAQAVVALEVLGWPRALRPYGDRSP